MRNQLRLVIFIVAFLAAALEATPKDGNTLHDDENKVENSLPRGLDPKYNKMLPYPPQWKPTPSSLFKNEKKETTKMAMADDPRFNKMLPEANILKDESKESSKSDDDYYNYDYEYDEDEDNNTNSTSKSTSDEQLKPIKGDDKSEPETKEQKANVIDDIDDDEEIVFNENVPCPRDCICERNVNSFKVATCSRLDADVQKFGSDITDLVVVDIGPKYPILLGPEFFFKIGLKYVSSIKISNCTIEYIHPTAFHKLQALYAVNLTNVGITMINSDTFVQNQKLRLLTISGNDLSEMTKRSAPNSHYLLKSTSVEELDLSNNNLKKLLPTAFVELTNLVYINLAQNNIKELPEDLFYKTDTIEELDLSYNSIRNLPQNIFNRTSLGILHLKYNDIVDDLKFGTADLQQLDLSFCSIKHVSNHMFNKMEGLTNLNLKGNSLSKIQPDSFLSLSNLRHIDLSMNDLDQISSLIFFRNPELDVIRLNDNPKLSVLPNDGFQSYTGEFNVYLFDVSNCAISALSHKTFSTMPHLTTLKLAWNNINNLDKGTFKTCNKLTELDLSNNLIVKLDDLTFVQNRDLTKLNLAGNPIKKLSAKLLLPLNNLKELDVSECELHTLMADNYFSVDARFKFYDHLRHFNASFNQIKKVSKDDIRFFKNLKTLDISNNPLKCNEDFKELMKYLGKKSIVSGRVPTNLDLEDAVVTVMQTVQTWDDLARSVCKRTAEAFKPPQDVSTTEKIVHPGEIDKKILKEAKEDIEEDEKEDQDADDDEVEDDDDYEYDDEDEDEQEEEIDLNDNQPTIKDKGLFAEEVNIIKETKDKFLRGKLSDEDEEVIIEHGNFTFNNYRFLVPMLVISAFVVLLMFIMVKVVSLVMWKRGERYRQAILASKNSFVYQKLSEEITPRTPKVHRYARINQV